MPPHTSFLALCVFAATAIHCAGQAPGTERWNFDTHAPRLPSAVSSAAIAADGTIYFGSAEGKVFALNPDGSEKWRYNFGRDLFGNGSSGSPTVAVDGSIYIGLSGSFCAFSPAGDLKWSIPTGTTSGSSYASATRACLPVIGTNGTIYFLAGEPRRLFAINPNGTTRWEEWNNGNMRENFPAIAADGTLYFADARSVIAFTPDGNQKWYFRAGNDGVSSPAIGANGVLYSSSENGYFFALRPDGLLHWSVPYPGPGTYGARGLPVVGTDGTVYFRAYGGVHAINASGTPQWVFPAVGSGDTACAVSADGTIYVGADDGKLYAVNPTGTQTWAFSTGGQTTGSPAIGADGTIYVGSADGKLYAIFGTSGPANSSWPMLGRDLRRSGKAGCFDPLPCVDFMRFLPTGEFEIVFTGKLQLPYAIEASTDLSEWLPFATGASANGTLRFLDSSGFTRRFYRASPQ